MIRVFKNVKSVIIFLAISLLSPNVFGSRDKEIKKREKEEKENSSGGPIPSFMYPTESSLRRTQSGREILPFSLRENLVLAKKKSPEISENRTTKKEDGISAKGKSVASNEKSGTIKIQGIEEKRRASPEIPRNILRKNSASAKEKSSEISKNRTTKDKNEISTKEKSVASNEKSGTIKIQGIEEKRRASPRIPRNILQENSVLAKEEAPKINKNRTTKDKNEISAKGKSVASNEKSGTIKIQGIEEKRKASPKIPQNILRKNSASAKEKSSEISKNRTTKDEDGISAKGKSVASNENSGKIKSQGIEEKGRPSDKIPQNLLLKNSVLANEKSPKIRENCTTEKEEGISAKRKSVASNENLGIVKSQGIEEKMSTKDENGRSPEGKSVVSNGELGTIENKNIAEMGRASPQTMRDIQRESLVSAEGETSKMREDRSPKDEERSDESEQESSEQESSEQDSSDEECHHIPVNKRKVLTVSTPCKCHHYHL